MATKKKKELSAIECESLLNTLKDRFNKHINRHSAISWNEVEERLYKFPEKMWSLKAMEETGGEPDVVDYDKETGVYHFYDCSPESPKGRRSVCYDRKAQESRKKFKPENNALDMAENRGVELLSEAQYQKLQELGNFDTKTSSWIKTPPEIRALGGAIFADFRYNCVFIYHNGAESYYAARGFRSLLEV